MRHEIGPSGISRSSRPLLLVLLLAAGCSVVGQGPPVELELAVFSDARFSVGDNRLGVQVGERPDAAFRPLLAYLEVEDPSGRRRRTEARWRLAGDAANRLSIEFTALEPGVHRGRLRIYDEDRAQLAFVDNELRLRVWPRYQLVADRSYYTGEGTLHFRLRDLQGAANEVKIIRVELRGDSLAHGQRQLSQRGAEVIGELPIAALAPGNYRLDARVYGHDGLEDSASVPVRKLVPALTETKIDQFTGTLLRNGAPFFPVGLYWLRSEMLADARRLRFNSGDYYYRYEPSEIAALMEGAADEGLGILLELSDYIRRRDEPDLAGIDSVVAQYRAHPALLAWYLIDEPGETGVAPEVTTALYRRVAEMDPYHPVYLVNNRPHLYAAHIGAADILAIDPYPIPKYPITRVREYVQEAVWSSRGEKPVWLVAQAFGGVEHWPRAPTPVELRNMVYQGLVQGAKGVLFYRFCQAQERHIQPEELWREVCRLAAELRELTPALISPDWQFPIRGDGGELSRVAGVDVMLKQMAEGYYLFTVNVTDRRRTVPLSEMALPPFDEAVPLHGAPEPGWVDGRLRLSLAPLQAAVYRLKRSPI